MTNLISRIHLVYPHGNNISCPDAIGRHLSQELANDFEIVTHSWSATYKIQADSRSAIVGHAHPFPGTVFRRSVESAQWGRRVLMQPLTSNLRPSGYLASVLPWVDRFLVITGNYWWKRIPQSRFAPFVNKMEHLDLAVDRAEFPVLRRSSSESGSRRFLYIGSDVAEKNVPFLEKLSEGQQNGPIAWAGTGRRAFQGLERLGHIDFADDTGKATVAPFDFLITVGDRDANPATILEAMAWGLLPVVSPGSGYVGYPGMTSISSTDLDSARAVLRALQSAPLHDLDEARSINWALLDSHFTWRRFADQVRASLEPSPPVPNLRLGPASRVFWFGSGIGCRFSPTHPSGRAVLLEHLRAGRG